VKLSQSGASLSVGHRGAWYIVTRVRHVLALPSGSGYTGGNHGGYAVTKRTDDYDEIVRVVQLYIDGFNDNDINNFKEAFHEDAWMFYINPDGSLYKNPISMSFETWASPPSLNVVGRIVSVTQVGDAANVQLSRNRRETSPPVGSISTAC
jgi:hypothetical protein